MSAPGGRARDKPVLPAGAFSLDVAVFSVASFVDCE